MDKPLVSVVIPVYNIPDDLFKECVDSLSNQTLREIELIFVNDASPNPNNLKYLGEKRVVDNRFKIISLEINKGVSNARNIGIEIAQSEYIGFVDADDCVHPEMYEKLYNAARKHNADIVACGVECIRADGSSTISGYGDIIRDLSTDEDFYYIYHFALRGVYDKIFRKKMLSTRFETELSNYEDLLFNCQNFFKAKKFVTISDILYTYKFRVDSASRKGLGAKQINSILTATTNMLYFTREIEEQYSKTSHYLIYRLLFMSALDRALYPYLRFADTAIYYQFLKTLKNRIGGFPLIYRKILRIYLNLKLSPKNLRRLKGRLSPYYVLTKYIFKRYRIDSNTK